MTVLTEKEVLARSRAENLLKVKNLNCWGSEITDISIICKMLNLQILNLSANNIVSLKDISFCPRLKELYLRKNHIELEEIKYLKNLPCLKVVWLNGNPCSLQSSYKDTVLINLPHLSKLDSVTVSTKDVISAKKFGTLYNSDGILPSFDGIDLSCSLQFDDIKYSNEMNQPKVIIEKLPVSNLNTSSNISKVLETTEECASISPTFVSSSIDIEKANDRRKELGLKPLPSGIAPSFSLPSAVESSYQDIAEIGIVDKKPYMSSKAADGNSEETIKTLNIPSSFESEVKNKPECSEHAGQLNKRLETSHTIFPNKTLSAILLLMETLSVKELQHVSVYVHDLLKGSYQSEVINKVVLSD